MGVEALVFIVLIVNGFGEEIGWRRYAVERLRRDPALVPTALAVGGLPPAAVPWCRCGRAIARSRVFFRYAR